MNSSSSLIENLVPGAQYQVVVYLRKGPLVGPPSDPVTFAIGNSCISSLTCLCFGLKCAGHSHEALEPTNQYQTVISNAMSTQWESICYWGEENTPQWKAGISHSNVVINQREHLQPGVTHWVPCAKNSLHLWTPKHTFVPSSVPGLCHLGWGPPHSGEASLSCRWSVVPGEMWALPRGNYFSLSCAVCETTAKMFAANVL